MSKDNSKIKDLFGEMGEHGHVDPKERRTDHKQRVMRRIDAVRQPGVETAFCTYGTFGIEEVRCKLCSTPIRKLMADDRFEETERRGNVTIIRQRLALATLPNYKEIIIECDDGSAHATGVCQTCAETAIGHVDVLERLYALDCNEMLNEIRHAKQDDGLLNWNQWAHRKVLGVKV